MKWWSWCLVIVLISGQTALSWAEPTTYAGTGAAIGVGAGFGVATTAFAVDKLTGNDCATADDRGDCESFSSAMTVASFFVLPLAGAGIGALIGAAFPRKNTDIEVTPTITDPSGNMGGGLALRARF